MKGQAMDGVNAARPTLAHPNSAHPNSAHPNSAHPGTAHPGTTRPGTTRPGTTRPGTTGRGAMTEGPVGPMLFWLTLPMVVGVMATIGYGVAETWFVAQLGPDTLSASSFTFPVTMTMISLAIGLSAGTSSVVARALGAGEAAGMLVIDGMILTAVLGGLAAVLLEVCAGPLFRAMGAPERLIPTILGYLHIWFVAVVLFMTAMVGLSAARAAGDSRFQGLAMLVTAIVNAGLAATAIFGVAGLPGLGLRGAAVGNALAWGGLLLATLWRLRSLGLLADGLPGRTRFVASARRILRVGLPAAGTNTIIPVSSAILIGILATFGSDAVAGAGVAGRIESLSMVPFFALSAIMNPFAGQNAGAQRLDRVREAIRTSLLFSVTFGVVVAAVLYVAAPSLAALFTHDPAVAGVVVTYLRLVPISYGLGGMIAIVNSAFNGLNRPAAGVVVSVARTLVINVPVAWLGGRLFGVAGVFWGVAASNLVVGAAGTWWVWRSARG